MVLAILFWLSSTGSPDLKASQNFLQLQSQISEMEEKIADRREFNPGVPLSLGIDIPAR